MQPLIDLFGIKDLIPHGSCLSWSPVLLWLNVISDLMITLAYYSIPLMLLYFVRQRKDLPYPWLVAMFAGFIVACGTTHLLSAITIWIPLYWLDGLLKAFTAIISVAAAMLMLWIIPRALSAPSAARLQAEIQQRKAAEDALQLANVALQKNVARTQLLLDSALDGIVSMDADGKVIGWNAQAEQIFGYSGEQALGCELAALIVPPAYRERHRQGLLRFLATGASNIIGTRLEITALRADASEFPIELTVSILGQKGDYSFSAYVRDITERKQVETELRESEQNFRQLLQLMPLPMSISNVSGEVTFINNRFEQLFGYTLSDISTLDDWWLKAYPDDDYRSWVMQRWETAMERAMRENTDIEPIEYNVCCKDGTVRIIVFSGFCFADSFVAVGVDVTERKQMEEKLRDSDAFSISILNSLTSHIAVLDAQGVIIAVNNAWRRFAQENGLNQEMLGLNYLDACKNTFNQPYGDEENAAQDGIQAVLAGWRETFHLEYSCHSPTQQRWFQMNVSPLLGSRRGVVISHKNITVRKKAQEALQTASQYARSLIEASLDPLVTISAEGKITDVNTATEQVTGVDRDNLIGSDFADYFSDPDKAREGYLRVFSEGFVTDYPLAIQHVSGKVIDVLYNASLYRDGNGNVRGVFAAARDITARKQIEAELMRSNADLEQFAYAVSHDMRQPLRMVSSYLSLIESALTGRLEEETQQCLDFAIDGAKRMDTMILSLLDYSRVGRKTEAKIRISSKASLDEALAFLKPELAACGGNIEVTGDWPELFASRDELTRLLQNLIGNALKYHEENKPPQVHIHGTIGAGSLRVDVRDNGIGIEPSQMDRLFKVFSRVQARSRFEGTGVGLALCRRIVEYHGGVIGVESAGEGKGCAFWFELPIVDTVNSG